MANKLITFVELFCIFIFASCVNKSNPTMAVTSSPKAPMEIRQLIKGNPLNYFGLTPGTSTKKDVLALMGTPNTVRTFQQYESLHYFNQAIEEYFLFDGDVLQAITSNSLRRWFVKNNQPLNLGNLVQLIGEPEVVKPFLDLPVQVFPDYGLAVTDYSTGILWYQIFVPTSMQEYRLFMKDYPLGYDPFPLTPDISTVAFTPGETKQEQVSRLLGQPDRIQEVQDKNVSYSVEWDYFLELKFYGCLKIFFDKNHKIESMFIIEPKKKTTINEIISLYGVPDIVQLLPDENGRKYGSRALIYLNRGIRITTNCETTCSSRTNDVITQVWYFKPTMLSEYQKEFPDSDYVKWNGFEE